LNGTFKKNKTYLKIKVEKTFGSFRHTYTKQKKGGTNLKRKTKLREAPRSKRERATKPREGQGSTKRYLKVLRSNITKRSVDE
jgi:hypothetical protein